MTTGEPLLLAALSAGAHFVDTGGDQSYQYAMYVRHESTARRAERVCLLGAGLEGMIGDLAAAWAAYAVCERESPHDDAAPGQIEERPLDDIAVSYVFDDLALSPSGQRAVFENLHSRGVAWHRGRWEAVPSGSERRRINAGADMGFERDVVSFPGGDVITIPRHVAARRVQTFVSTSRRAATTTALRLLARAMPLLPRQATGVLAPYVPTLQEYARTRFCVVAQARRGADLAHVSVRGSDLYRTSAAVAAWVVRQLLARSEGPAGMRAPSELFVPRTTLLELAGAADLRIETSFE